VKLALSAALAALALASPVVAQTTTAASDWRTPDPENVVVIDTTKGRVLVELQPAAAPEHAARIKRLAREGFYDGVVFHRVIDWFMAQTGDPLGTGEGQSPYPDLKAEFTFRRGAELPYTPVSTPTGAVVGFIGSFPIQTQPDALMALTADQKVHAWGLFCPGVLGMARGEAPDSANSQFFLMRQTYPPLDKRYTAFGRVILGLDVVRALKIGEPPVDPDKMVRVRMMADIPAAERPVVEVLDTRSAAFAQIADAARQAKGADFSVCDVEVPSRVR
jgi:peptidylprolyl isomerase